MRIDISSPAASSLPAEWGKAQAKGSVLGASSATEDRATFSQAGNMIQELTAQVMKMPDVRQDRVDALRQSVTNGTYSLDPQKTAVAIIDGEER